jgi:ketosteroid isomerase-like protein
MSADLEQRIKVLEGQVQSLRDREAIRELRFRYHSNVNEGRWDEIAPLFTDDAFLDFGYLGKGEGRATIAGFFARATEMLPFVKQFIHNHSIVVDGDRATAVSYLEAKSVSGGRAFFVAARYDDVCVRSEHGWLFERMTLIPYFTVPFEEGWAQEDLLQMGRREAPST